MNLESTLLESLKQAGQPLKAVDLVKRIKAQAGRAATPKAVSAALDTLVAAGQVHRILAGKSALFTTLSLEEAAMAMLKTLVHSAKLPPQAVQLRAKLPHALHSHFDAALSRLVAQGDAFVMPGAKRLVHAHRPKPSELLDAAKRRALQKIFDEVNPLRTEPLRLEDFTAWLDGDAPALAVAVPVEVPQLVLTPSVELLREWYEEDRRRSSTMMIAVPRTFEKYEEWATKQGGAADSQVLRNLMTELYNSGCLLLEPCERPQDLPEHERAMLVPMSLGPPGYSWCWIS